MRAYRFFPSFRGGDARAWLFAIIRNASWSWLRANRPRDEGTRLEEAEAPVDVLAASPEEELVRRENVEQLRSALYTLEAEHREVIVLRELEELSYREIASIVGIPIGTVMSRLSRARTHLRNALCVLVPKDARP